MRLNKILIALLIAGMLTCSFSAVFAEDGTLSDGTTVPIPEGYSILDTGSGIFTLATEDQQTVITVIPDATADADQAKETQVAGGAEFVSQETIQINGVDVIEQKFTKESLNLSGYLFTYNDKNYVVTFTSTGDNDATDAANPVNIIITSLTGGAAEE